MSTDDVLVSLTHEFTLTSRVQPPVDVGVTPMGGRMYFAMGEGEVSGARISGRFLSGGDWLLIGSDGYGRVDVRGQIETHDGAFIYIQYLGYLEMNEALGAALQSGQATDFSDAYLRTAPRLECGDPRYAWVNHTPVRGRRPAAGRRPSRIPHLPRRLDRDYYSYLEQKTVDTPETVVRKFFEQMSGGRMLEAIETWCTDDCSWENSGLPAASGKQAMLQMMKNFIDGYSMKALVIDIHALAVTGSVVFTERTDHMDDVSGKRLLSFPLAGVLRVRDGKIERWSDYFDPRPLLP